MMKKPSSLIKLSLIVLAGLVFTVSCNNTQDKIESKTGIKVNTVQEFKQALTNGEKSILAANLDFNNEIIVINHSVQIDSIDNESQLKNVYFTLSGPTTVGESINVSFQNIVFDGSFDASGINFETEESFEDKFGSWREEYKCITGDVGYFSLSLDNCVIKNYASDVGSAIYVENNDLNDSKTVIINNCKIYNNYSEYDTIHLSHVKLVASITNSEFYSNYAYKAAGFSIANGSAIVDKVNVHDNIFVPYDENPNNVQLAGGGVFVGGVDIKMTNSYIVNNKTNYGGGLAVSAPYVGNKNVFFENISIKNNEAIHGGGILAFSMSGQPITFANCEILSNKAQEGSALYTETYARWISSNNGGLVQFFFTTFGLNTANDNNTFKFYNETNTKGEIGIISLKGCFSIGNDTYESSSDDYNYIATKEQALLDEVIDEKSIENVLDGLYPNKGSKADIKLSADIYKSWSSQLEEYSGERSIGKEYEKAKNKPSALIILLIVIPCVLFVALIVFFILFLVKRKKHNEVDYTAESPVNDNETSKKEYLESLSSRERKVVELLIAGKKRKDIAEELNYSENTIKKDLTTIYFKLHVVDKYDLMLQYKDLI